MVLIYIKSHFIRNIFKMCILIFLRNKKIWTLLFYCYVKYICKLNCALNRNLSAQCYSQKINNFNKRNSQIDRRDRPMKQAVLTVCVLAIFRVKRFILLRTPGCLFGLPFVYDCYVFEAEMPSCSKSIFLEK